MLTDHTCVETRNQSEEDETATEFDTHLNSLEGQNVSENGPIRPPLLLLLGLFLLFAVERFVFFVFLPLDIICTSKIFCVNES